MAIFSCLLPLRISQSWPPVQSFHGPPSGDHTFAVAKYLCTNIFQARVYLLYSCSFFSLGEYFIAVSLLNVYMQRRNSLGEYFIADYLLNIYMQRRTSWCFATDCIHNKFGGRKEMERDKCYNHLGKKTHKMCG